MTIKDTNTKLWLKTNWKFFLRLWAQYQAEERFIQQCITLIHHSVRTEDEEHSVGQIYSSKLSCKTWCFCVMYKKQKVEASETAIQPQWITTITVQYHLHVKGHQSIYMYTQLDKFPMNIMLHYRHFLTAAHYIICCISAGSESHIYLFPSGKFRSLKLLIHNYD